MGCLKSPRRPAARRCGFGCHQGWAVFRPPLQAFVCDGDCGRAFAWKARRGIEIEADGVAPASGPSGLVVRPAAAQSRPRLLHTGEGRSRQDASGAAPLDGRSFLLADQPGRIRPSPPHLSRFRPSVADLDAHPCGRISASRTCVAGMAGSPGATAPGDSRDGPPLGLVPLRHLALHSAWFNLDRGVHNLRGRVESLAGPRRGNRQFYCAYRLLRGRQLLQDGAGHDPMQCPPQYVGAVPVREPGRGNRTCFPVSARRPGGGSLFAK